MQRAAGAHDVWCGGRVRREAEDEVDEDLHAMTMRLHAVAI